VRRTKGAFPEDNRQADDVRHDEERRELRREQRANGGHSGATITAVP
jgi:hypothetical protein